MAGKDVASLGNLTIGLKDSKDPREMRAKHQAGRQLKGRTDMKDRLARGNWGKHPGLQPIFRGWEAELGERGKGDLDSRDPSPERTRTFRALSLILCEHTETAHRGTPRDGSLLTSRLRRST